ncbi:hypothetical protein [Mucilaginibacter rubeus]|uniref:Carboxypeptidase-like regulatory domain-containing protein n=1 Tax=Mucilaginibacter rubeus TaxID=2027860 RepID=A0A5C1I7Z4_9SPHI|nr:hypothetical protein [Mucilaginibacter rubeus]QEM12931.1 carboxypeptidase-like regulatory domain-containing protein [Mucilaginibacter rubeus]
MNKILIARFSLVALLSILTATQLLAKMRDGVTRNINIAGLVVDSKTLQPIEAAAIYGADEQLLGKTDANGYYKVTLNFPADGEMKFKLKISKKGYNNIIQSEHWGNLSNGAKALMYFGLDKTGASGSDSFSKLINNLVTDLGYSNVLKNFDSVKAGKTFADKLTEAKSGNQDVLIRIDDKLYIVDKTGWIAISSAKDSILINNKQLVIADQLNSAIKRKDIKSMTPLNLKNTKFAIYTK